MSRGTTILAITLLAVTAWTLAVHRPSPPAAAELTQAPTPEPTATLHLPVTVPVTPPRPATEAQAADSPPTNRLYLLARSDNPPKLTREQIDAYLAANHRNAGSLLAAYRNGGDPALLKEAEKMFPNDPRVDYAAIFKSDSPEERRQWLDNLRNSAPDNSLADYLAAQDDFKAGRTDQALQEINAANAKPNFQDYTADFIQNAEDAYTSAGFSDAEAAAITLPQTLLPQLAQLKQLGLSLDDMATSYLQAGDVASAQAAVQMALNLAERLGPGAAGGQFAINNLVDYAIQKNALGTLDPASTFGDGGQSVQSQLDELAQQRNSLKSLNQQTEAVLPTMSDQDLAAYFEREKLLGSQAAMQWVIARAGQK